MEETTDYPLHAAAATGDTDTLNRLLQAGADIDRRDDRRGRTALMLAADAGNGDLLNLILGRGADINARGRFDAVPLRCALDPESAAVARFPLARGADPNTSALEENYPLLHAAIERAIRRGQADTVIVDLLLQFGADPDRKDSNGWTPLMVSNRTLQFTGNARDKDADGAANILRLLREKGAKADGSSSLRTP